jgi:galactokinase
MRSEPEQSSLDALADRVRATFGHMYEVEPARVVAAPGRVNLIGEHTDYNDGFVLPAAIDRYVVMASTPRNDRVVRLHAMSFERSTHFSLDGIERDEAQAWSDYQRGVAWVLQQEGYVLPGLDLVDGSTVPVGSGLSSSAAIELATALTFQLAADLEIDGARRALLCQRAENEFVGMRCGIMDQFISSLGQADHALLIDCRSLEYRPVPLPAGISLVVCDTRKRRGLVDSEYNNRRRECERGAAALGVPALRDVSIEMFAERQEALEPTTRRRCRHVVTENQRVLDAVEALQRGDLSAVGGLMDASHQSLRDDYEVSCAELDIMVEEARRCPGVIGARMTGAGFGGCTVNLVEDGEVPQFLETVPRAYERRTGLTPEIYVCRAVQGVHRLE